ncbi:bh protein [Niallia oryzisoli]|uniref:bh protein n=1 Tax=Niallia oryzisoli TaxID=1737571 RepID=UPI0037367CFC
MKESKVESYLHCTKCKEETPHIIIYINNEIKSVECETCQQKQEIELNIIKEFYKELYNRISTKPSRITQEYKQDLNHFILSIPKRVIRKPYSAVKYINSSRKIIKNYKKK